MDKIDISALDEPDFFSETNNPYVCGKCQHKSIEPMVKCPECKGIIFQKHCKVCKRFAEHFLEKCCFCHKSKYEANMKTYGKSDMIYATVFFIGLTIFVAFRLDWLRDYYYLTIIISLGSSLILYFLLGYHKFLTGNSHKLLSGFLYTTFMIFIFMIVWLGFDRFYSFLE